VVILKSFDSVILVFPRIPFVLNTAQIEMGFDNIPLICDLRIAQPPRERR
jgi:hypothetical protein